MYLIGIDIGTSGTKTVIFDVKGNAIASDTKEYDIIQPQNGWAEQDPLDWWDATCSTIKNVIEKSGINPEDIKGIGLSGQMHGLVMLGEDNKPLRNSIIWCDQRTAKECDQITELVGKEKLIEITANPALTGFTASKIMWVKNNEPELYARCKHILLPKDYIRFMLTGEYATEVSDASGMQLLDVKNRCWSDEVLEKLDIDKALLGKVYESPEVTGKVTEEASKKTGLAIGTVVVGGAGDNAAAAVGTGVVVNGKAFTTIGTSGVVFAHTDEYAVDKKGRVHTFCCAVPGKWHVMGVTQAAGLSLKWFRDEYCKQYSYKELDDMAAAIPIGADKLIYLPYLMGERTPHLDPNCRGAFVGLSAIHKTPHMIRAIMEGVSYSLADCLGVLTELGVELDSMLACGGGGTSSLWRQMLADIFDLPINTLENSEGPALGVALLAGVGAGIYESVEDAVEKVINVKDTTNPLNLHDEYMKYYEIYKNLYFCLKEQFEALNR